MRVGSVVAVEVSEQLLWLGEAFFTVLTLMGSLRLPPVHRFMSLELGRSIKHLATD